MIARTDQSIKPYRPEPPLRERARQAFEAEIESEAAERAEALVRAQRNVANGLIVTCRRNFHLELDPETITVEIRDNATSTQARPNPTVVATTVIESIRLQVAMAAADAARFSGQTPLGNLCATPLCPICSAELALPAVVLRLADLGRVIGELGCGNCDWEPSA